MVFARVEDIINNLSWPNIMQKPKPKPQPRTNCMYCGDALPESGDCPCRQVVTEAESVPPAKPEQQPSFQQLVVDNINDMKRRMANAENNIADIKEKEKKPQLIMLPEAPPPPESKLPVRYADKNFPYYSMPLFRFHFFLRKIIRNMLSYVLPMDVTPAGTQQAIQEANEEREQMNILKIQRQIFKVQRALHKALRNNQDSLIYDVGSSTSENAVIAHVLRKHFAIVGFPMIEVRDDHDQITLHIEIKY